MDQIVFPQENSDKLLSLHMTNLVYIFEQMGITLDENSTQEEINSFFDSLTPYQEDEFNEAVAQLAVDNSDYVYESMVAISIYLLSYNKYLTNTTNYDIMVTYLKDNVNTYNETYKFVKEEMLKIDKTLKYSEEIARVESKVGNWLEVKSIDSTGNEFSESVKDLNLDYNVSEYIWMTQQDSRVRDSHKVLHNTGRLFSQSPLPSEEYRCRCWYRFTKELLSR